MTEPTPTVTLDVPDELWVDEGDGRLRLTLSVNGYSMHLEAWAVTYDKMFSQHLADNGDEIPDDQPLDDLAAAVNADGSFETTHIRGQEYILVASPFC